MIEIPSARANARRRPIDGLELLTVLGLLAAAGILFHLLLTRFPEGELVLTPRGCRVLAQHGVRSESLDKDRSDAEGLCRVRVRYEFTNNTARFGTIRLDTPQGDIDIELPASEVVSKVTG